MLLNVEFGEYSYTSSGKLRRGDVHNRDVDIPEVCPVCGFSMAPGLLPSCFVKGEAGRKDSYIAIFRCAHCSMPFIAYYHDDSTAPISIIPHDAIPRSFSKYITALSPNFVETYNQALAAETMQLNEIAGMGYRKAVEYLVKDYLILRTPDCSESIRAEALGSCIGNRLTNERLKAAASRAVWLGNDFTHYTRKYENYEISHLKQFIEATMHWIEMELITDEAENMGRR